MAILDIFRRKHKIKVEFYSIGMMGNKYVYHTIYITSVEDKDRITAKLKDLVHKEYYIHERHSRNGTWSARWTVNFKGVDN